MPVNSLKAAMRSGLAQAAVGAGAGAAAAVAATAASSSSPRRARAVSNDMICGADELFVFCGAWRAPVRAPAWGGRARAAPARATQVCCVLTAGRGEPGPRPALGYLMKRRNWFRCGGVAVHHRPDHCRCLQSICKPTHEVQPGCCSLGNPYSRYVCIIRRIRGEKHDERNGNTASAHN